jgi:hypothetical protein
MSETTGITAIRGQEVRLSRDYASPGRESGGLDAGDKLAQEVSHNASLDSWLLTTP